MERLHRFLLLPELRLDHVHFDKNYLYLEAHRESKFEVCPKCAHPSCSVYDHRIVRIRDAPVRNRQVMLVLHKRRMLCEHCQRPFMEYIPGIKKRGRTTQRYKSSLLDACEDYTDLERVRRRYRCSDHYLYEAFYEMLDLEERKRRYPWPKDLGVDEKRYRRKKPVGIEWASVFVDHKNRRVFEVVEGKKVEKLTAAVSHIPGRENVLRVTMDMSTTYRAFVRATFPNATVTVDKFHVLKLLTLPINQERMKITGDDRKNPIRKLLLKNGKDLNGEQRRELYHFLDRHSELKEIYHWKEKLHRFYRIKGYKRACRAFHRMIILMGESRLEPIQTLTATLQRWKNEVLNYFKTKLTNARCEGFNNKITQVKLRAYGYRNFKNFRLRVLNACR